MKSRLPHFILSSCVSCLNFCPLPPSISLNFYISPSSLPTSLLPASLLLPLFLPLFKLVGDAFLIPWMHTEMLGALASAVLKMGCCHHFYSWNFSTPPYTHILEREGEMRVGGKSAKSAKLRNVFSLKQVCLKGLGRWRWERGVSEVIRPDGSMAAQCYKC